MRDREDGREEERIEGVLGQHGVGVRERRHDHGHRRDEERRAPRDDEPREEVRGDRGERHQDGVERERHVVGDVAILDERPHRRDHGRVDLAPAEDGHVADGGPAALGDAPREVRVDELVGEDPGARHPEPDEEPDDRRGDDDERQARTRRRATGARPRGARGRARRSGRPRAGRRDRRELAPGLHAESVSIAEVGGPRRTGKSRLAVAPDRRCPPPRTGSDARRVKTCGRRPMRQQCLGAWRARGKTSACRREAARSPRSPRDARRCRRRRCSSAACFPA